MCLDPGASQKMNLFKKPCSDLTGNLFCNLDPRVKLGFARHEPLTNFPPSSKTLALSALTAGLKKK